MVDRISTILVCQQVNECNGDELMYSSVVGPVVIGTVYSCSISVINDEGIDSRQINNITTTSQGTYNNESSTFDDNCVFF